MTTQTAAEIANRYETQVEEIEAATIALIRELKAEAQRLRDEAQRVYEETGDRETALEIDQAAQRIAGGRGLIDRLQTIGQGIRL